MNVAPGLLDFLPADFFDFEKLRTEIVAGSYAPSFGWHDDLRQHIEMLQREFAGQVRLKFVHAVLNVLLRRRVETDLVYAQFRRLWEEHGDMLIATLDSRWLVSACDSICDYSDDRAEASEAILVGLFANTVKLAETERFMSGSPDPDAGRIQGRTPLFDGMTAFMPGDGDMVANLVARLDRTLSPHTLSGIIGRELVSRVLSSDALFARFRQKQRRRIWNCYLSQQAGPRKPPAPEVRATPTEAGQAGYILLNDTGRLSDGFHMGTTYVCQTIRDNLAQRGLKEVGWANDRPQFERLLADSGSKGMLVVLNGEGTLHHGAPRAAELLSLCALAKEKGHRVAVVNSVWEANPDHMVEDLRKLDLLHVRDNLSRAALPPGIPAETTPDISISLFVRLARDGQFPVPRYRIAVMDSVVPTAWKALLGFAEEGRLPFFAMPAGNLHKIREDVEGRSGPVWPRLLQLTDVMASQAWVTGRFHGLIAALCVGRPVCALSSNTGKIEGLLNDAGLIEACLLGPEWLAASFEQKRDEVLRRFEIQRSREFELRRAAFLERSVLQIDRMFDSLAGLTLKPADDGISKEAG